MDSDEDFDRGLDFTESFDDSIGQSEIYHYAKSLEGWNDTFESFREDQEAEVGSFVAYYRDDTKPHLVNIRRFNIEDVSRYLSNQA